MSRGGNVLRGCPTSRCVQREFNGNVLGGCPTSRCVQRGLNGNVLRGVLHQVVSRGGSMVMSYGVSYIEMCPEGVQW